MTTKKELAEKALEIMASHMLTIQLSDTQITMYEGKWDEMIAEKVAWYLAAAKEQGKKEGKK